MEINITSLLSEDLFQYSHSRMEGGENAGETTWKAALDGPRPLLSTPEEIQQAKDYFKATGGWTKEEIAEWGENEVQALFLQFIAGDVREMGFDSLDEMTDRDWIDYEADENKSHNIYRSGAEIFFYLGH